MELGPKLVNGEYYFATVDESQLPALSSYPGCFIAIFREEEGLTIVFSDIKEDIAGLSDKKIEGPFALITLGAQTGLYEIGILAKITGALAKEKIAVNAFSAYHHDHILVPYGKKDAALAALRKLG